MSKNLFDFSDVKKGDSVTYVIFDTDITGMVTMAAANKIYCTLNERKEWTGEFDRQSGMGVNCRGFIANAGNPLTYETRDHFWEKLEQYAKRTDIPFKLIGAIEESVALRNSRS